MVREKYFGSALWVDFPQDPVSVLARKDFDAENTSSAPTFEMTTKYSNYNEVTPITDTLNPDDYKEIEDCRLLSDFEDMIEKLEDDKDGSFVMEMEQIK